MKKGTSLEKCQKQNNKFPADWSHLLKKSLIENFIFVQ